jgi:hypothetical protein
MSAATSVRMGTVDERKRGIELEHQTMMETEESPGIIGTLLGRITEDLKAIGRDELALARVEITQKVKSTLLDTLVMILCGVIITIALAFVCMAGVDALAPVIPQLWARLLIGAAVYLALSGGLLFGYAKKLKRDLKPVAPAAAEEAKKTVEAVKEELRHA